MCTMRGPSSSLRAPDTFGGLVGHSSIERAPVALLSWLWLVGVAIETSDMSEWCVVVIRFQNYSMCMSSK